MPAMLMAHAVDPREDLWEKVGNLDDEELFHNQVLVAVYIRPEKMKLGKTGFELILTDNTRAEDESQSKVGMIVKMGPTAFKPDLDDDGQPRPSTWTWPSDMAPGNWVYYRASDGWATTRINQNGDKVLCRILSDTSIRGRIQHPDQVW